MSYLKIKRRTSKSFVDQMNISEKYIAIKDFSKARKIFESIVRKIIYDKLQKRKTIKKKIMMKIKFVRRAIEKIYKQA